MQCIFSVDVEDWFHILNLPSTPDLPMWDGLPSHVERDFLKLLDIFSEANARVTCFFLGWVARKFPSLVREAERRGHEIASHGYAHRLIYAMTAREFYEDAVKSKQVIEDAVGSEVIGYRSSGFSVTKSTPWFFDIPTEAGYRYDSSIFPAIRSHGGMTGVPYAPYCLAPNGLIEFPITVATVLRMPMCFFGGGYLRLFPWSIIRAMTMRVLKEGRPVVFYIHPREIEPEHPRLPMNTYRQFKSYVNLKGTEAKVQHVLSEFKVTTFRSYIEQHSCEFAGMPSVAATASAAAAARPV